MEPDFWLQRWREHRIGFHRDEVMPLLVQHWPALKVPRGTRVFVPLCGKTLDMAWFAQQELRVLGADLSPLAIRAVPRGKRLCRRNAARNPTARISWSMAETSN